MSLTTLPNELVQLVALAMPLPDAILLSLTCKKYLALLNRDRVWIARYYKEFPHIPRTAPLIYSPKEQYRLAQFLEPLRGEREEIWTELELAAELVDLPQVSIADVSQRFPKIGVPGRIAMFDYRFIRSSDPITLGSRGQIEGSVMIAISFTMGTPIEISGEYYERAAPMTPYSSLPDKPFVLCQLQLVNISCSLTKYLAHLRQEGYWPIESEDPCPAPECFQL